MSSPHPTPEEAVGPFDWEGFVAGTMLLATVFYASADFSERSPAVAQLTLPSGTTVQVHVAETPQARSKGLANRGSLEADGLLLRWPDAGRHPIWMAGMRFPLDLAWLDADGLVLAVREAVPPCLNEPCPLFDPADASVAWAVLELQSGRAHEHGIVAGSIVSGLNR